MHPVTCLSIVNKRMHIFFLLMNQEREPSPWTDGVHAKGCDVGPSMEWEHRKEWGRNQEAHATSIPWNIHLVG